MATTPADTGICRNHRELLNAAMKCETAAARFIGASDAHAHARAMLTTLAEEIYSAATVFESDPTLATEHDWSPRFRVIDLLIELGRQLPAELRYACGDRPHFQHQPLADRWEQADTLYTRAVEVAGAIRVEVPRPDHATPAGQQAISLERLTAHHSDITQAASLIHNAVGHALKLTHPDPHAVELAALADRVAQIASALSDTIQTDSTTY